jgi:hypothetical protein
MSASNALRHIEMKMLGSRTYWSCLTCSPAHADLPEHKSSCEMSKARAVHLVPFGLICKF